MAEIRGRKIIFTADNEEPNCLMCDHCAADPNDYCYTRCGAEYGWASYRRTINIDDYLNKDKT